MTDFIVFTKEELEKLLQGEILSGYSKGGNVIYFVEEEVFKTKCMVEGAKQ